ncbi:MAG TPA: ferredoxin family protein [Acidobacteriaceae bacterium]|nr:ferredoxin family protein [Acidobacteriaceae bacterium]
MRRYSVITDQCTQDLRCVAVCLRNAIHPTADEPGFGEARQLFIHPKRCIGCGSCVSACDNGSIFEIEDLPESLQEFAAHNAAYYAG